MFLIKKSWDSLDKKQKKYSVFIFVMMFIAMLFESLSIGIMIPLISTLLNYNTGESIFSKIFISVVNPDKFIRPLLELIKSNLFNLYSPAYCIP